MRPPKHVQNVLVAATAVLFGAARIVPGADERGPVTTAAVAFVSGEPAATPEALHDASGAVASRTRAALDAFRSAVHPLSHPRALESAFRGYFAYRAAHPDEVRKPLLYFVDYGLPSTAPRGYVFDMDARRIVDGPFTVAHGRGSAADQRGVPTRFSNVSGSAATSLGLYLAQETYAFNGKTSGRRYGSVGLRLMGVSGGYNDGARARGVVAHGAPYVTRARAGRSEGCPAMEQSRAQRLLPALANGAMVFLFAPDPEWMTGDPWLAVSDTVGSGS